jgi:hypothetical protein
MPRLIVLATLLAFLVACDGSGQPPKTSPAAERLSKAEAAMDACKKRVGLDDVATPTGVVLDNPATRGQALTPELAGQLRLKVQCRLELDELLAARRP